MISLNENETIILRLKRHPIILVARLSVFAFLLAIPFAAAYALSLMSVPLPQGTVTYPLSVLAISLYYLYVWLFSFHTTLDYLLDLWLVTNERIINMEQKTLFSSSTAEQEISRIQDISEEVKGFFPTIFNYGDVLVQTAGEKEKFIFKQVQNPQHVVEVISKLLAKLDEPV